MLLFWSWQMFHNRNLFFNYNGFISILKLCAVQYNNHWIFPVIIRSYPCMTLILILILKGKILLNFKISFCLSLLKLELMRGSRGFLMRPKIQISSDNFSTNPWHLLCQQKLSATILRCPPIILISPKFELTTDNK